MPAIILRKALRLLPILSLAFVISCSTNSSTTSKNSTNENEQTCGNGKIDPKESCDSADAPIACSKISSDFISGEAFCNEACNGYDTSECVTTPTPTCGNSVIDAGEFCDPGMTQPECSTAAKSFVSGTLGCQSNCRGYDTTNCISNQISEGTNAESVIPKLRDPIAWAGAKCGNGEPFSYEVSLAPIPTKKWMIYLGAGGQCDGIIFTCNGGATPYRSFSASYQEENIQRDFGTIPGILNRTQTDNPDFFDANMVLAKYCTNDLWSGERTEPISILAPTKHEDGTIVSEITPIYFSGRKNVRAMLESLERYFGLDDSDPETKILLTGSSAGGVGVNTAADLLAPSFPNITARRRAYVVSSAGSLVFGWANPTYSLNGKGFTDEQAFEVMANQYQSGYSPECEILAASEGKLSSACLSGYYSYTTMTKLLNFHMLLHRNIFDQVYMGNHKMPPDRDDLNQTEIDARLEWKQITETEFKDVKWLWAPYDSQGVREDGTLEENFHGVYNSGHWAEVPPSTVSINTCGIVEPLSFRDIIHHFWNDTSTSFDNELGERYCYQGDWFQ